MLASIVANVLGKLTSGGQADLTPEEADALPALLREGLLRSVAVDPQAGPRLSLLRAQLSAARGIDAAQESALREQILALSDALAEASGGVELRGLGDGGAYRAGGSALGTYHLTQKGRALLGDLGPRASRVGALELSTFLVALDALKANVAERASRAQQIVANLHTPGHPSPFEGAARLAALGGAARREPAPLVARHLNEAYRATASSTLTPKERWSCAESAVLAVAQLEHAGPIVADLLALRQSLTTQYGLADGEDALDAAVMLLPWPEAERARALERSIQLSNYVRSATGAGLPLATTLIVERTKNLDEVLAARLVFMNRELVARGLSAGDAAVSSALLSLHDGDASWLMSRTDALQAYLGRFAPIALWAPAAALALLEADVPEILDDVRLASAAVQRHLLAGSGAEAVGLAIKLLFLVAALGHGNEGDAEEQLMLRPAITAAAQRLGLAGIATSLPMLLVAGAAFHRPLLTAQEVALAAAPMHDSYVYGASGWGSSGSSGWGSSGWGSSGWGGGHRSWG